MGSVRPVPGFVTPDSGLLVTGKDYCIGITPVFTE